MITFLDFLVDLNETTLTPGQQAEVNTWPRQKKLKPAARATVNATLGEHGFTSFPLEHEEEPEPELLDHLDKHGYKLKDYKAGTVSKVLNAGTPKEKEIETTIDSALGKTKASPDIVSGYNQAKNRFKQGKGLHVVISTTPHAIGGMSTGTSWQSCMSLDGGVNKSFIPKDLNHGTHAAYLVKSDDPTAFTTGAPTSPVARIALKPFHAKGGRHTIFRPENSVYGANHSVFASAVSKWADHAYPAKPNTTYTKDANLYDDDKINSINEVPLHTLKERITKGEEVVKKGESIRQHDLDEVVRHGIETNKGSAFRSHQFIWHMSNVPNLTSEHVKKLYRVMKSHPNEDLEKTSRNALAIGHGDKFSSKMIDEYFDKSSKDKNGDYDYAPPKLLGNTVLSDKHISKVKPIQYPFIRKHLVTDKHHSRLLDHYASRPSERPMLASTISHFVPSFNKENLDKVSKLDVAKRPEVNSAIRANKNFGG